MTEATGPKLGELPATYESWCDAPTLRRVRSQMSRKLWVSIALGWFPFFIPAPLSAMICYRYAMGEGWTSEGVAVAGLIGCTCGLLMIALYQATVADKDMRDWRGRKCLCEVSEEHYTFISNEGVITKIPWERTTYQIKLQDVFVFAMEGRWYRIVREPLQKAGLEAEVVRLLAKGTKQRK